MAVPRPSAVECVFSEAYAQYRDRSVFSDMVGLAPLRTVVSWPRADRRLGGHGEFRALAEIRSIMTPDTLLACDRALIARKYDSPEIVKVVPMARDLTDVASNVEARQRRLAKSKYAKW